MRRLLVLLLALCLLLSACAARGTDDAGTQKEAAREQLAAAEGGEATNDSTGPVRTSLLDEPEALVKGDGFSITLADYAIDTGWGPILSLELVNETDRALMYAIGDMSVNGVMCDPFWGCEVPAGETVTSEVWWGGDLAEWGILALRDLRIEFLVFDSEDYAVDYLYQDKIDLTLPAEGEVVEDVFYDGFDEQVLAEGEGFRLTARNYDPEGWFGPTVLLCLVNETDRNLLFSADAVTVNGADCDPCWADEVWAGCAAYSEMSWSEPDLEEAGVKELSEVAFRLTVFDADDWSGAARLYDGPAAISIP